MRHQDQQHSTAHNKDTRRVANIADTAIPARQLPNPKSYPSKFMQSLSGSQTNPASRSPAVEERRDPQAIDPLSHVRLRVSRHSKKIALISCAAYSQPNEYAHSAASEDTFERR